MRSFTQWSRTTGFVLAGWIVAVGCGGNPNLPPAVAAQAPSQAAGLRILLHHGHGGCDATEFGDAVAKALKESGVNVVTSTRASYDFGVSYTCFPNHYGTPTAFYTWQIRVELIADIDTGNRDAPTSWLERGRLAADVLDFTSEDPLKGESMNECFQGWKGESRPEGSPKAGMIVSSPNLSEVGVASGDPPNPEWHEPAAYFLVNKILGCEGFAKLASVVKDSGLGASANGEDLPVGTLMNLCEHRGPFGRGFPIGLGKIRTSDDACDAAANRDPQAAARVRKRRQQEAASAADAAEYNRTHLSNGCTRDNPVSCGYGENTWCCPNAYPTCGGCGSNCCPSAGPSAPSGGGGSNSLQCTGACQSQSAVCWSRCNMQYLGCPDNVCMNMPSDVNWDSLNVCREQCNANNDSCKAACR